MQRQLVTRVAAPIVRSSMGVQRRNFVQGMSTKKNNIVEKQKFFQRQGVAVNNVAPTWQRKGQSDKAIAAGWAVVATGLTLMGVKMITDMTWGWNKREL